MKRLPPIENPKVYDYSELYHKAINKLGYTGAKLNYLDKGKNGVVYIMNYNNHNYTVKFTGDKTDASLCYKIKDKNLKYFCKIYNVNKLVGDGFGISFAEDFIIVKEYVTKLTPQEYKDFSNGYIEFLIAHGVTNRRSSNKDEEGFITSARESKVPDYVIDWYLKITREMQANGFFTKDIGAYNIGKNSHGDYVVFDMGMSVGGQKIKPEHSLEINEENGSAVTDIVNQNVDKFQFDESQHVSIPTNVKSLYYNDEDGKYFKDVITKLGYDYSKFNLIGSGSNGIAFKLDNLVIKFTREDDDAQTSYTLTKNHSFDKFVCKVYGVYKIQTKKYQIEDIYGPYVIVKEYIPPLNDSFQISFSRLRKISEETYSLYASQTLDLDDSTIKKCYDNFMNKATEERIKPEVINWYLELNKVMVKNKLFIDDINYTNVGSRPDGSFVIFDIGASNGGKNLNKSHDLKIK